VVLHQGDTTKTTDIFSSKGLWLMCAQYAYLNVLLAINRIIAAGDAISYVVTVEFM
jgi:hypothetical protein